jgi:dienelactone hydrolase
MIDPHESDVWNGGDALIGRAAELPTGEASTFSATSPILVRSEGRQVPLYVRVTAPTTGRDLGIILVSHGGGTGNYLSSLRGLGPLVDYWAAHGFVVIQPTHLGAKSLGLPRLAPESKEFWYSRVKDLTDIVDDLDAIESAVPGLQGRVDRSRLAVAGHSFGGQTASMLLGAHFVDEDGTLVRVPDDRVKAGVLLSSTGAGGDHMTEVGARYTCLRTAGFDHMITPALVVVGDQDDSAALSSKGPSYHADPYTMSPGPKSMLTLTGAEHQLGGVTGYDAEETTDENPERVAILQRLSWAYLRSALYPEDTAWPEARDAFRPLGELGRIENK